MIINLRSKKDLEGFQNAGKIAADILAYLLSHVREGVTTKYINDLAIEECEKAGVIPAFLGYRGFSGAICASVNNELVHGVPKDTKLVEGDLFTIDIGINFNGYIGDTAETVVVGGSDTDLILAGRKALWDAIHKCHPGNNLLDVSWAIYNVAKTNHYSVPKNYGGHGVDINNLHGPPFIPCIPDKQSDIVLREGMILAIEPMLIMGGQSETNVLEDKWTVVAKNICTHSEHTVFVTEEGPIVLTDRR